MDLSKVTKAQLRDFIESKIEDRKNASLEEINIAIKEKLSPILDALFHVHLIKQIEDVAASICEKYAAVHTAYSVGWNRGDGLVSDLNWMVDLRTNLRRRIQNSAYDFVLNAHRKAVTVGAYHPEIYAAIVALQAELASKVKLINENLPKLKNELNNVVSLSGSGKQAYSELVALGVDMSDLPAVNPNLPAIVKLSVDVCVLNGNC